MPRTSLRRLSTLAAVRAAAAARRVGPVHGKLAFCYGFVDGEEPAEEGKRRVYTKEDSSSEEEAACSPGAIHQLHPWRVLNPSASPCITLRPHLEQSALLLLFYDFFGSHRSPLGSANKSKKSIALSQILQ